MQIDTIRPGTTRQVRAGPGSSRRAGKPSLKDLAQIYAVFAIIACALAAAVFAISFLFSSLHRHRHPVQRTCTTVTPVVARTGATKGPAGNTTAEATRFFRTVPPPGQCQHRQSAIGNRGRLVQGWETSSALPQLASYNLAARPRPS